MYSIGSPVEDVSNVIYGDDDMMEIVQRHKLGPEWLRRYQTILPSPVTDFEIMNYALEVKNEDLIIDILSLGDGDFNDAHFDVDTDTDDSVFGSPHNDKFLLMLNRFAKAELSQKFGDRLASLPIFIIALSQVLCAINSLNSHIHGLINEQKPDSSHLDKLYTEGVAILRRIMDVLTYFGRIECLVLRTYCRDPINMFTILATASDDDTAIKLIALAEKYQVYLSDYFMPLSEIFKRLDPPANRAIELLSQYPYTWHM
jgi:hypothetical protein